MIQCIVTSSFVSALARLKLDSFLERKEGDKEIVILNMFRASTVHFAAH
jgi:hypothetical protein